MTKTILDPRIKPGMVYIRKNSAYRDDDQYVVVRVTEDEVSSVKITHRQQGSNWIGAGYNWFGKDDIKVLRQMKKNEFQQYNIHKIKL
jgi:hypothetical protein